MHLDFTADVTKKQNPKTDSLNSQTLATIDYFHLPLSTETSIMQL